LFCSEPAKAAHLFAAWCFCWKKALPYAQIMAIDKLRMAGQMSSDGKITATLKKLTVNPSGC